MPAIGLVLGGRTPMPCVTEERPVNADATNGAQSEMLVVDWRPREWDAFIERTPAVRVHVAGSWEEAGPQLASAQILVSIGLDFTRDVVAKMSALQWMQGMGTGMDHLLAALVDRPDVLLTSATGIHGPQMTEGALSHMLCLSRDMRRSWRAEGERQWDGWDPQMLAGRTVGIVGIGTSGAYLARVCKALGMTVLGVSRTARDVAGIDRMHPREELPAVAAEVDFLVLTVPLSEETTRLVDARVFDAMKPSAYLINIARGAVVDTDALVAALRSGSIAGAGLDALDIEPLPSDSVLWDLDNVFITAHIAGRSDRYVDAVLTVLEPNLQCWLDGDFDGMRNVVQR
jgi:phosphoglycerate dehydrogenase-like enzyme